MSYAALVSLAQTIAQILYHDQSSPISLPENQEIISIHEHSIFLQAFLEDSPEKTIDLEGRIREVANKAEDTIEYLMLKNFQSNCGSTKSTVGPSKVKLKRQLRKAAEKMKAIVGEVIEIKNGIAMEDDQRLGDSDSPAPGASSSSKLASTGKIDMVGFDADRIEIIDRLVEGSYRLQVVAICGMAGIGKTTLAGYAYHHPFVMEHFDIRAWVTISQDYSAREILSSLLVSMGVWDDQISGQSIGLLAQTLYKSIIGRTYLIVIDDLWSRRTWDEVRKLFPDDGNGSRIMLTTRERDVAAYVNSCSHLHEMCLMDADQSWDLLQREVFLDETCPGELEDVGREIARSCSGLPLSIVTIAELLSRIGKTRASWEAIAENVISAVATKDGPFEKMLSLSYTRLPHHLRSCFLYMGGFQKGYEIRVSELIKLWVAEGFVKPDRFKTFEEMAEEYLEDLVKRSLVLVSGRKSNGKIKSCELHDSVRELCWERVSK